MRQLLTTIVTLGASSALLVYAVATLRGMRHKKLYPLLRVRTGTHLTKKHAEWECFTETILRSA